MYETGDLEKYELPVISSRRGIIQGLLLLAVACLALFVATGIDRVSDGIVLSLFAVLIVIATTPFLELSHPISRVVIVAPLFLPFFIAAATASSTATGLMLAVIGLEVLAFGFLFLQTGTAQITVRGVQRRRLVLTSVSFDEMSGVQRFESITGKLLRHAGFGSTSVELTLFSGRTVRLNVAPEDVDAFIDEVQREIDPMEQYDLFFLAPAPKTVIGVEDVEQEVKPIRRRGKKAKKLADLRKAASQIPTAAR